MMRALFVVLASMFFVSAAWAGPGDYSLRIKGGPSFKLNDWENQARLGGEFDYDFGYSMGFNLMGMFGISNTFRFGLIPSFRYDYLYLGPAAMYALFGAGYAVFDQRSGLEMRMGSGLNLPLGDYFEFNTDVNFFITPVGIPGTPVTLDWLIAFGFRFQ